ncbi:sulfatase [Pontiella sulfatireligans]|uniref:Arylsulfatase n=1 Tax=Pontiella sulfatireligans TaxID=2750658 RepID=A0A6C2UGS8_9BACT|nr:sulfatase [Pontiella sulfatireligans]SPS74207.1 sulfatase S1_16 [Kiritimatiellales bacterium]VGO18621.1 Arylsulfatase [Pontiella sulfatireligans]
MKKLKIYVLTGLTALMAGWALAGQKPNILFLLVDDLGWTDLTCNGSSFYETPNIDALAASGMFFTDAYAAGSVCSPTRNSILSGKYPARTGHTNIGGAMKRSEVTIAEALKDGGYATYFTGKWHLGNAKGKTLPEDQGFDINIGGCHYGQPPTYFYPYFSERQSKKFAHPIPGLEVGVEGEYLTERLTDEAINYLESRAGKPEPFFLYFSYHTVHTPLEAPAEKIEKYKKKAADMGISNDRNLAENRQKKVQNDPTYAAMVECLDESVGRLLSTLKTQGMEKNTIVVFMSDNGGLSTKGTFGGPTSNLPLRAGKAFAYEGGIREPMIIRWPGVTKPGSRCSVPVTSTDFYPTLLDAAGLPLRPKQHADGVSLVPLLKGGNALEREAIYWHYPHNHGGTGAKAFSAVRMGDYKLIHFHAGNRYELYCLTDDLGEMNDLSDSDPEKTQQLKSLLTQWQNSINSELKYGTRRNRVK